MGVGKRIAVEPAQDLEPPEFPDADLRVLKAMDPHQVLGVVLEPDTVDAQKDRIAPEVIERAAWDYNVRARRLGLMHREEAGGRLELLESYIAPAEFTVEGQTVRKGTWLMRIRVKDEAVWEKLRTGASLG